MIIINELFWLVLKAVLQKKKKKKKEDNTQALQAVCDS